MSGPQTMREALIAELIGDLDTLLTRTEEVKAALPLAADSAARGITAAGEKMLAQTEQSANRLRAELARDAGSIAETVKKAASEANTAATIVARGGQRFALLALLTGLAGGVVGGTLAGLFAARYFLGV